MVSQKSPLLTAFRCGDVLTAAMASIWFWSLQDCPQHGLTLFAVSRFLREPTHAGA